MNFDWWNNHKDGGDNLLGKIFPRRNRKEDDLSDRIIAQIGKSDEFVAVPDESEVLERESFRFLPDYLPGGPITLYLTFSLVDLDQSEGRPSKGYSQKDLLNYSSKIFSRLAKEAPYAANMASVFFRTSENGEEWFIGIRSDETSLLLAFGEVAGKALRNANEQILNIDGPRSDRSHQVSPNGLRSYLFSYCYEQSDPTKFDRAKLLGALVGVGERNDFPNGDEKVVIPNPTINLEQIRRELKLPKGAHKKWIMAELGIRQLVEPWINATPEKLKEMINSDREVEVIKGHNLSTEHLPNKRTPFWWAAEVGVSVPLAVSAIGALWLNFGTSPIHSFELNGSLFLTLILTPWIGYRILTAVQSGPQHFFGVFKAKLGNLRMQSPAINELEEALKSHGAKLTVGDWGNMHFDLCVEYPWKRKI